MPIVDSHAHLYFDHFSDDLRETLGRARDAGVVAFVNVGTDPTTTRLSFALAAKETDIFPTAGIHPNDAATTTESDWAEIESFARDPRCVGIGETGLDWFRSPDHRDVQIAAFERQVLLAHSLDLPVVIHCREAHDDTYRILESFKRSIRGVMHCFSGTRADAERAVALGLHVSYAGPVSYKKNDALRASLSIVPRDKILVETDCPFLPPEGFRGKRNEPSYLSITVGAIATTLGIPSRELATLTARNAVSLFRLPIALADESDGMK